MASVKLKFKSDKTLSDGSHPIVIQVIHNRRRKLFYLSHSATMSQWNEDKNMPKSNHPDHQIIKSRIKNAILQIKNIIADFENRKQHFSLDDIEKKFKDKGPTDTTFEGYCEYLIKSFKETGKNGNALVYQASLESFKGFSKTKKYLLSEIDYVTVRNYQEYLSKKTNKSKDLKTEKKLTPNGISFYLRTLRAIINRAIKEELIEESAYPFKNISIKSEKTRKRAVNKVVFKMVEDLDVSNDLYLQFCKDLFMFSFYNRGMNFVDMAYLKVNNIEDGRIIYTRHKTGQLFSIKITEKAKAIIDQYNDLKNPDSFIFPIINRKGNEYDDYRNAMRLMNKKLKKISEMLKLDIPLTTYVTRHSWATIAKKAGVSTAVISEGLGHQTEETTQIYLDSFENDVLDDANELITN